LGYATSDSDNLLRPSVTHTMSLQTMLFAYHAQLPSEEC
jgi:hypothetical protein